MNVLKLLVVFSLVSLAAWSVGCGNRNLPTAKEANANFPQPNFPKSDFPEPKKLDVKFPEAKQLKVQFPDAKFPEADFPEVRLPQIKFPQTKIREGQDLTIITLPADVLFDFDKAEIRPDAEAALQEIKDAIAANYPQSVMQINGHTDSIASDQYNQDLSERRASAVFGWLATNGGIAPNRMQIVGYGEKFPVAPNTMPDGSDNVAGRQKNRRVEIVIKK